MPNLSNSDCRAGNGLILDLSLPQLQILAVSGGKLVESFFSEAVANQGLFEGAEKVCRALGGVLEIDHFIFCRGPGSALGIRLAAMAIRTWVDLRRGMGRESFCWSYSCFSLGIKVLRNEGVSPRAIFVAQPLRKGRYLVSQEGQEGEVAELGEADLEGLDGSVWLLPQLEGCIKIEEHLDLLLNSQFLRAESVHELDVELYKRQEFVKWSGERHRGSFDNC